MTDGKETCEMLQCPLCGRQPDYQHFNVSQNTRGRIICACGLGLTQGRNDTEDGTILKWNTRSDHAVQAANERKAEQAISATVGTGYGITFAPTLDRPPETMVGETVFDSEGNAIGWIANATVGTGTCRNAVMCNVTDCEYNHKCCCTCGDLEIQDQECMTYAYEGGYEDEEEE